MNPIFQMVIYRVVADLDRRCRECNGRLEVATSVKHSRRTCERCEARQRQGRRPARSSSPGASRTN